MAPAILTGVSVEITNGGIAEAPDFSGMPTEQARSVVALVRADYERRHLQGLQHLAEAERQIARAFALFDSPQVDVPSLLQKSGMRRRRVVPSIEIVRKTCASFGPSPFTLSELVIRVAREFPAHPITRAEVSRRLFDLRRTGEISLVPEAESQFELSAKQRKRLYLLVPPKIQNPLPE